MKPLDDETPVSVKRRPRPSYLPPQESLSGIYAPLISTKDQRIEQLEAAVAQEERQIEGLLHIAASLRKSRNPQEAMRSIVVEISHLLGADRTTIYELNEDQTILEGLAVQGESSISVRIPNGRGLAGLVASTKRSINLADAYKHPQFDIRFDKLTGYRTQSVLCVPMFNTQGEVIGVVQVLNKHEGVFSQEDNRLLSALSSQAAITLEALRLEYALETSNQNLKQVSAQVKQQLEEQELLFDIERAISSSTTLKELSREVLSKAASVIGSELVAIFVPDEVGYGPAFLKESSSTSKGVKMLRRVEVGDGILGKTASRGEEMILVGDRFEQEAIPRSLSSQFDYPVKNALATPLMDGRDPIGSPVFINCTTLNWSDYDSSNIEPPPTTETPAEYAMNPSDHLSDSLNHLDKQISLLQVPETMRNQCAKSLRFAGLIARQLGRGVNQILLRRNALRQDRLVTIGQMLSGVLHDMRGPMTSISGYAQLMARSDHPDTRSEMAKTVQRKIQELNEMTREVMGFARGERTILSRKVYLKQFIDQIVESMSPEFEEHGIELIIDLQTKGVVYFDEGKMMRVVTNIARNARQAMGDSGTLTWTICREVISTQAEPTPTEERTEEPRDQLVFILSDTGPGIPEVLRERVFEAFMTSGKEEGTGLGLAIVKRIIDDHQGVITLSTQTDVGTSFKIQIPQPKDEDSTE